MNLTNRRFTAKRQAGISLLEVLVTLVIVAIALLGIAGLLATSVKLSYIAQSRSAGTILASDILERMRANPTQIGDYTATFGTAITAGSTLSSQDLARWKTAVAQQLPSGDAKLTVTQSTVVTCDDPVNARCWEVNVELRWAESNVRGGSSTPVVFSTKARL